LSWAESDICKIDHKNMHAKAESTRLYSLLS
jgi:hypothetical protein